MDFSEIGKKSTCGPKKVRGFSFSRLFQVSFGSIVIRKPGFFPEREKVNGTRNAEGEFVMFFKTPSEINRNYKSFKRFLCIIETAAAYGFRELAESLDTKKRFHFYEKPELIGCSRPRKLRMLLEELGPTFVKFGQILSTRTDLLPPDYTAELAKLTENVTPFPQEEVVRILTEELGRPPEEVFREFDRVSLAAASIGQVHSAVTQEGKPVVIKIQRPGIREIIRVDLEIMSFIARKLEQYNDVIAKYEPVRIVEEFSYALGRELNYQFEAANLLRFYKNMNGKNGIVVPKLYLEYTTPKVMTMERIYGDSAARVLGSPELREKYDLPRLAERGVNSLLSQIFEYGFFHADPHPGNIFLLTENRIAFIDFGMMGRISETERSNFIKIFDYMLRGQISLMTDSVLRMTITGTFSGRRDDLERDIADLVDENINLPLDRLSASHILQELMILLNRYELALKPNLYLMFKSMISIEHVGRAFDPDLKIVEMVKPFIRRIKLKKLNPMIYFHRFFDDLDDNITMVQNLPKSLRTILRKAENGDLTLRVEHHHLDDIEQTLYVTGERLSRSMLVMALVIASALVIVAKVPPFWNEIPVIGMTGFAVSAIVSVLILIDDHNQRKKFLRERALRKKMQEKASRRVQ